MNNLHEIQILILKKLLFKPECKYSDLRVDEEMENNKLNFHLKQLKELNLVIKKEKFYILTQKGKEFGGFIDTESLKVKKQAKISAWVCCERNIENSKEYLIGTRLKSPFYGCQGFISGKVEYGEKITEAASRELYEETNLTGQSELVAIKHFIVLDKNTNELLEDKFMFLCRVSEPQGEIIESNEGKAEWVKESDLSKYITNHFENFDVFKSELELIKTFNGSITFIEEKILNDKF